MNDLIYVGLTILFLVLSYWFILLCERLMDNN